ncbi:MAG TPA: DMT family transporter [Polyangiales bacterium]|nr:DMT family transporter [Polyangiales bacterium]
MLTRSMTQQRKGFWLTIAGCAAAACFLIAFKLAAGLGDTTDATLVMLVSAATLNSLTSFAQERGRPLVPTDRVSWLLAIGLSGLTLLGNELAVEAVRRISAPMTSVLQQTQVLFVALLGRFILNERVTLRFWVGAGVAAAGLYLIQGAPSATLVTDRVGMSLAAGSAACWGLMAIYTRKYIHRIRPIAVNALRLWISIALWFAVHMRLPALPMRWDFAIYCAIAGAFGPYISRTALMHALAHISPTKTTLIGLATPAITIIPAFFVFGTVPGARELLGSAIMIAGIAIPVLGRATPTQARTSQGF